jgi:uncharacterized protein YcbK (DUF882 family)
MALFLRLAFLAIIVAPFANCRPIADSAGAQTGPEYRLRFFHTHTNERVDIVYRRGDTYLPEALNKLDFFLRDWRTGEVSPLRPSPFRPAARSAGIGWQAKR